MTPTADLPLASRADLRALACTLWMPVRERLSPRCARATLGHTAASYGTAGSELEAWSRPLWMLAPLSLHDDAGAARIACGLDHGTNPSHPEFWGWPTDQDQRLVEMAAIGFSLCLNPEMLWPHLPDAARTRVSAWLGTINDRTLVSNNWLFFRVLVNLGLARVGAPHAPAQCAQDLDDIEAMHLGGGWYEDGHGGPCDHYNGFAFHFYGLLYSVFAAESDPDRAARFRERAGEFAQDFLCWFDDNGAAIPYGRSLTYRFAVASFWSAAAFAGLPGLSPGQLRGLILRHLRWWQNHPILDAAGLLTLGFAYPNLQTTEIYNSPASPYWAMKIFLPLALPDSHPFWQVREDPLPKLPSVRNQAAGRLLAMRSTSGHATLLTAGQNFAWDGRNYAAKYSRFAYSSRFAFSVPLDSSPLAACAPDSSLVVSADGSTWISRTQTSNHADGDGWIESSWSPFPGTTIRSRLEARPPCHLRTHTITTDRPIHLVEGGFAVPCGPESLASMERNAVPEVEKSLSPGAAFYAFGDLASGIRDLPSPETPPRESSLLEPWPNTNLMAPSTVIPALRTLLPPGTHILHCEVLGDTSDLFETRSFPCEST